MKIALNLSDFRKMKGILTLVEIKNPKTGQTAIVKALWDTGATYTAISERMVNELGLVKTEKTFSLDTIQKAGQYFSYYLTLRLDTQKTRHYELKAPVFDGNTDFDLIIGLDILVYGQFTMGAKDGIFHIEFIENV